MYFSSCEDLLPLDVSHALMEVMYEQLQNILHAFHQLQTAERCTTERPNLDTSSWTTKINGVCSISHIWKKCKILPYNLKSFISICVKCFFFVILGVESSKVVESQLGDFLVFLRRVLSLRVLKSLSTYVKWIDPLMSIISHKCSLGKAISKHDKMTTIYQILAVAVSPPLCHF